MRSAYRQDFMEIVDVIQRHGYPVELPEFDAHQWWALDPRARSAEA